MTIYQPISCDLHDYVEIACLYGYDLKIEMIGGESLVARAITTRIKNHEEFLVVDENGVEREIRLDLLLAITPLNPSSRFARVLLQETPITTLQKNTN